MLEEVEDLVLVSLEKLQEILIKVIIGREKRRDYLDVIYLNAKLA